MTWGFNPTTGEFLSRGIPENGSPDYPTSNWALGFDRAPLTQGAGDPNPGELWPTRYWIGNAIANTVNLMTPAERTVVDNTKDSEDVAARRAQASAIIDDSQMGLALRAIITRIADIERTTYATERAAIETIITTGRAD